MIAVSPPAVTLTTPPVKPGKAAVHGEPVKPDPVLIVFGADKRRRWRAAWFSQPQAEVAGKEAVAMGLSTLPVTYAATRALAAELRQGEVFASGRAFVPFAAKALHARLQALAGPSEPRGTQTAPPAPRAPAKAAGGSGSTTAKAPAKGAAKAEARYPRSWDGIAIGSLVLITEGEQDGWYEAEVVAAKPGGEFTLQWRDWPDLPMLVRRREEMALLHPNASAAAGA